MSSCVAGSYHRPHSTSGSCNPSSCDVMLLTATNSRNRPVAAVQAPRRTAR